MTDYRAYAREVAARDGVDQDIFERQINQESGFNPKAGPSSAGACGIAQIVPKWHPNVDPWDPTASLDYATKLMAGFLKQHNSNYTLALACYNAGPGNTAKFISGEYTEDDLKAYFGETIRYVSIILQIPPGEAVRRLTGRSAPVTHETGTYNPDQPTELQRLNWTCSVRTVTWMLKSIGIDVAAEDLHDIMVPGLCNEEVGLRDGSGSGIAKLLQDRYGLKAGAIGSASFDDVVARAGRQPLGAGGHAWGGCGHWTAVRRVNGNSDIELANPAGTGPVFGQQTLSREQFDARGPFSLVWAEPKPRRAAAAVTAAAGEDELMALRRRVAELETIVAYLTVDVSKALRGALGAADAAACTLEAHKPKPQ